MWLLPLLSRLSAAAGRTYYRLTVAGGRVPPEGPVVLVANHPNSLFDPGLVAAAARRPVRFLAKAPLFTDPQVGWLVRGSGSIPVYRRVDDPEAVGRNDEMFRAVHVALAEGAAVGIFPEGLSHSEPSLAPLKTGAARIALGAAALRGAPLPIIPVGLSFRRKERFRSEALVLVGEPVAWDDLAAAADRDTARELTVRIEAALRRVTVNLERWEDAPLVEWAEAIHAAEHGGAGDPVGWVERLGGAAGTLAELRRSPDGRWAEVAREVVRHGELLRALGLRPADLHQEPRSATALRWALRRLGLFLLGIPLAVVGGALFYPPYRLTAVAERGAGRDLDVRATYKLMAGALLFAAWIAILAAAAAWWGGPWAGLAALAGLPALALATLSAREHWRRAREEARRFLLLRGRRGLHRRLRERQRAIADRLHALLREVGA